MSTADEETHSGKEEPATLSVCVLASGSKGNAIFISDGTTSVLVDAGISGSEAERRLKSKGLSATCLKAVIISHEHADHIFGAGILSRRFRLPVYVSSKTQPHITSIVKSVQEYRYFECGTGFTVNTLHIHPFSISHDAADPAGFTVSSNGAKIGIATDMGIATSLVKEHLKDCRMLILEANHDMDMLIRGPYPWHLKQRIKGRTGHLSNDDSRLLLEEIQHDRLSHVILAHLSEHNNTPQKALETVSQAINLCNTRICVANQHRCSEVFCIGH